MRRDRSFRRHQLKRIKDKVRFIRRQIWDFFRWDKREDGTPAPPVPPGQEDPAVIGIEASVHCKGCSCIGCGNPRRHFGELTKQEKIAEVSEAEQIQEVDDEKND